MRVAGVAALVLLATGCGSSHRAAIVVTPQRSAESQPIDVRVTGLSPHEHVTLSMTSTDAEGIPFAASMSFSATENGRIDLATSAPLGTASYIGVWQMGLLTSMDATRGSKLDFYDFGTGPRTFTVTARANGRTLATRSFMRAASLTPLTVRELTVAHDGFQGGFAAPRGAKRLPAVLELGGSEGGAKGPARSLAANGLAVLFVGYFDAPGLPNNLKDIPLEYFARALAWLDRQPEVDPARVTVMGTSYGSEAALLLGVHYPKLVHAVAAISTGSVVTCGIRGANRLGPCLGSAWTFHGRPLPYTKEWNQPDPIDEPDAVIPVERIRGPLLLTCGGVDQIWASCLYAHAIDGRLKAHRFPYPVSLYDYAGASHFGSQVSRYWPGALQSDINVPGDERDREQLWPHAIAFLRKY